jgi:Papain-like cysteine protease AvrRpt2
MTAQIRPNRMEVNDRFPMLGFAIRSDSPGVDAEVVLASDIALFRPENRAQRTAANFYSSREHGMLAMPRGEGIFTVPSDVLARLIGNDRVFFGLATGKAGNGGLTVDALPRDGSPYVSLRGFTGRTLRRSYGSGRANTPPVLEWSGDSARPGTEPVAPMPVGTVSPAANGGPTIAPPANGTGPVPYDDGFGPIPTIPAASAPIAAEPVSSAMIIGPDDVQQAQRYAPEWRDLYNFRASAAVNAAMVARGFSVQTIADAAGALNLDKYEVNCSRLPTGYTAAQIVELMRKSINNFIDTDNTEFLPYASSDAALIASANPVPAVWKLDIIGPDNAAVVIAESTSRYFRVCTVETPDTGSHPVSGTREWGYRENDGAFVFYTRAADRATYGVAETVVWTGANHLWRSLQTKLTDWINANGGAATIGGVVSERFHPEVVRILYGAQAQGLTADDASAAAGKAIVMPALPGDARGRATRIGGEFATRIGEALDLGLAETALTPLFDKLDPPVAAVPLAPAGAMSAYASAQSAQWSINWDGVDSIAQPTAESCWATSAAMLLGWRDQMSYSVEAIATQCGKTTRDGLDGSTVESLGRSLGLTSAPPQSYTPEGFRTLIENNGPLWVGKLMTAGSNAGHVVLVVGMYEDGGNHYLRIIDPWDRPVGRPGAPGRYAGSHSTGSRYIMRYEDFQAEYEMAATYDGVSVLILFAGVPLGRTPNTSTAAPPTGFAMQAPATSNAPTTATEEDAARTGPGTVNLAPPPEPVARGMDAGAVATIAGVVLQQVISNSGDVSWTTDQFRGIKHPNDTAPANPGPFQDATPISLNWPVLSDSYIDDISAFFRIDWQHNGKSIGNVRITNTGTNDAIGWSLAVRGTIMDDNRLHPPHDCAGLRITLHYHFTHVVGSDQIAMCDIEIFGDGTHTKNCRWIQSSLFAAEQARSMVAA